MVDLAEQPLDLPGPEPQVVGVDDVHGAVDPQRGHVQPDDPARAEHHPQARRRERDHPGHALLGRRARDGVEVVEDEQQVATRGVAALPRRRRTTGSRPPGRPCPARARSAWPAPRGRGPPRRSGTTRRCRGTATRSGPAASSCRARRGEHQHDAVGGQVEQTSAGQPRRRGRRELRREVQPALTHPAPRTFDLGGRGRVPRQLRCPRASRVRRGTAQERSGPRSRAATRWWPVLRSSAYAARGRGHGPRPKWSVPGSHGPSRLVELLPGYSSTNPGT